MATPKNPALKSFRPITPALRYTQLPRFDDITKTSPEPSLTRPTKRSGGRNAHGRITSRRRGGGHKRHYRVIDFKRNKVGVRATVEAIEYDPFRTARIALVKYADGELRYIIAPRGLKVGATIENGPNAAPSVGNTLPLGSIPLGSDVHNIELIPGKGGQLVRSAGASAVIQSADGDYVQVRLPSGEVRKVHVKCTATLGEIGNQEHKDVKLGKAGRSRWMGKRPRVRGMVMNPHDHPNGGGEAKSKSGGGRQHPTSPWGQLSRGFKTRQKHKPSNKFIVQRRKSKKRSR